MLGSNYSIVLNDPIRHSLSIKMNRYKATVKTRKLVEKNTVFSKLLVQRDDLNVLITFFEVQK